MLARLAHVRNWIFDLDNTLYPASARLFDKIDERMGTYISTRLGVDRVEARRIQKNYFHHHGTTLAGMMAEHGVDPHEFLDFVHNVEMDALEENRPLAEAIARLPGRRIIFTNADAPYAQRVLARLGLDGAFDAIHDIHAMDLRPKPQPVAYAGLVDRLDIDPATALFAEDMARNLAPAKAIGMTTLWVDNGSEQGPLHGANDAEGGQGAAEHGHIDYITHDVRHWLDEVLEAA